jgi:Fe-S cluster assembly protein SufD
MMQTMSNPLEKVADPHVSAFEDFERDGAAKSPSWINLIRRAGIAHFAELGIPTIKHEEWRYTSTAPIAKLPFRPVLAPTRAPGVAEQMQPFLFEGLSAHRLVFVDGHFSPQVSACNPTDGVKISSLAEAIRTDADLLQPVLARYARGDTNAFVALNTAFLQDGAFIFVPEGAVVVEPVHVLFLTTSEQPGATRQPRNLILASRNSQVKIIEHYVSLVDTPYFTNAVSEIVVGEGAVVEHCKIQSESSKAFHVATIHAQQDRNSRFVSHSISIGAKLARNDIYLALAGQGIDSILNGLYVGKDDQLVDHHTVADHRMPHCNSHEFYHGILEGRARAVFNGKIFVRKDAQRTDAKQTNKNLLLSEEATIDTKPQLEIYADDVKCTHGATVGQLDEESIFYLRSRGIGLEDARRMLIHAFASDILNRISIEPVRAELDRLLFGRLEENLELARAT